MTWSDRVSPACRHDKFGRPRLIAEVFEEEALRTLRVLLELNRIDCRIISRVLSCLSINAASDVKAASALRSGGAPIGAILVNSRPGTAVAVARKQCNTVY